MTPAEMSARLDEIVSSIGAVDVDSANAARSRIDSLTKPVGSLGVLEDVAVRLAGIQGTERPAVDEKSVIVMAADHGVAKHGVSAYPSEVTVQMISNFLAGGAAINVLARQAGARISVVDMGVASELPDHPNLIRRNIAAGTNDFTTGPAMTRREANQAVLAGAEIAMNESESGASLIVAGDMGIGNTTSATAIICGIARLPASRIVGPGTGLDEAAIRRKAVIIDDALRDLEVVPTDAFDVVSKVGGFEIAGIAGLFLGAAATRTAIVADGLISTAGALVANTLAPAAAAFMFAGHRSSEPAQAVALERMELRPLLDLEMRLGEGTGAALATVILEAACRICSEMATFEEARVSKRLP